MGERKISGEIKTYIKVEENENITYQNLLETAQAALRGKFTELNTSTGKQGNPQINNLSFHVENLKKKKIDPK